MPQRRQGEIGIDVCPGCLDYRLVVELLLVLYIWQRCKTLNASDRTMRSELGCVECRASEPIQYDFMNIDDLNTFYCMKVFI